MRHALLMFERRPDRRVTGYEDDFEDVPPAGFLPQYGGGVLLPLLLVGYGVSCIATGHGILAGDQNRLDVFGPDAVALGTACASLGLFLHCHYFWGNVYQMSPFAVVGKVVSALAFIGGLRYLIIHLGVFGR